MKTDFFKLPRTAQMAAWICLGCMLFMVWDQIYWWNHQAEYFFGFLVPLFVGYILFERWEKIKDYLLSPAGPSLADKALATTKTPDSLESRGSSVFSKSVSFLFFLALIGGLMTFLLGALYRGGAGPQVPASLLIASGFAAILLATVYVNSDVNAAGMALNLRDRLALTALFIFPALIWLISAPMISFLYKGISLFLLDKVATVVFFAFDFLGFPIEREGNILIMPKGQVGVADACSGIRSQMACLFSGSFLAAVFLDQFWKKVLLVISAMSLAFLFNILRSLFLTIWAYRYGVESISGSIHDITGYAILGLTCLGLVSLLPLFKLKLNWEEDSPQ